jgi:voltage-gated anion channel
MPFNLGCWGFTFPLGVYSLATLALAHATGLAFFSVVGSILVGCLAAMWLVVAVLTIVDGWDGHLFHTRPPRCGSAHWQAISLSSAFHAVRGQMRGPSI